MPAAVPDSERWIVVHVYKRFPVHKPNISKSTLAYAERQVMRRKP